MDIVLDASLAATALVEVTPEAEQLRRRLAQVGTHAPHLVDAEVGSVLRRRTAAGFIEPEIAAGALRALDLLIANRYPHGPLASGAWALRDNLAFYDALYVALAARLGFLLLTADARLARAPSLPCAVELVPSPPSAPASSRSS
jgi:predicted nucleic acid-binding protein